MHLRYSQKQKVSIPNYDFKAIHNWLVALESFHITCNKAKECMRNYLKRGREHNGAWKNVRYTLRKVPIQHHFSFSKSEKSSIVYPLCLENKSCVPTIMRCGPYPIQLWKRRIRALCPLFVSVKMRREETQKGENEKKIFWKIWAEKC